MKASERMKSERVVYGLLALAGIAYAGYFTLFQFQMHRALWPGVDQTNMEQTLWNTLHGQFMRSTVYPPTGELVRAFDDRRTESRLATHVQPFQLLLLLPYALFPCSETLLLLLGVAVGLGAISLFRLAQRRLASPWLALAAAIVYLLLPAVQTNSGWEIHGASFLPPLMLAALDAAESGKRFWWWTWALPRGCAFLDGVGDAVAGSLCAAARGLGDVWPGFRLEPAQFSGHHPTLQRGRRDALSHALFPARDGDESIWNLSCVAPTSVLDGAIDPLLAVQCAFGIAFIVFVLVTSSRLAGDGADVDP